MNRGLRATGDAGILVSFETLTGPVGRLSIHGRETRCESATDELYSKTFFTRDDFLPLR